MNNLTDEIKRLLTTKYDESSPRGLKVREWLHQSITINPKFALSVFKRRPFNFKYFSGELLWYLCGDFKVDFITQFSNFWSALVDENGEINSNYGAVILNDQFVFAYNQLIKDKNTRQSLIVINEKKHQKETKDFPCTLNLLFYIRNNKLNMRVHMRSQDIFYGLQYDAPWYSVIHQNMWLLLKDTYPDLELGDYIHQMDNVHYYERHFELAENINKETESSWFSMELLKPIITIESGKVVVNEEMRNEYLRFNTAMVDWKFGGWREWLSNLGYFKIEKHENSRKN